MFGLAVSLALALAPPVQQIPSVEVGNWLVGPVSGDACQMVGAFGDHVMVSISEDATGNGHFVFSDDRWLLKQGDVKQGTLSWDAWQTATPVEFTAQRTPRGQWILLMPTDAGFTENLVGRKHFWLRVPGVEFDEDFDVSDAAEAVRAVASCNEKR